MAKAKIQNLKCIHFIDFPTSIPYPPHICKGPHFHRRKLSDSLLRKPSSITSRCIRKRKPNRVKVPSGAFSAWGGKPEK